jgi:hypothetical protein
MRFSVWQSKKSYVVLVDWLKEQES